MYIHVSRMSPRCLHRMSTTCITLAAYFLSAPSDQGFLEKRELLVGAVVETGSCGGADRLLTGLRHIRSNLSGIAIVVFEAKGIGQPSSMWAFEVSSSHACQRLTIRISPALARQTAASDRPYPQIASLNPLPLASCSTD